MAGGSQLVDGAGPAARLLALADGLARAAGVAAACAVLGLIVAMLAEVVARYVLSAPTLWAFDLSYMLNGSAFVLGTAAALRLKAHVAIDVLAVRLPPRLYHALQLLLYPLLLAALGWIGWVAWDRTFTAIATGETQPVSPWAPRMWPFFLVIAVGLTTLLLQVLATMARHLAGLLSGRRELD